MEFMRLNYDNRKKIKHGKSKTQETYVKFWVRKNIFTTFVIELLQVCHVFIFQKE